MSKTPNDQLADVKNPTSPAYAADYANRQRLGHPLPPVPPVHPLPEPPVVEEEKESTK